MKRFKVFLLFFIASVACGPKYVWVRMKQEPQIRVLLAENKEKVVVSSSSEFEVMVGNRYKIAKPGEKWEVFAGPEIIINSKYSVEDSDYPVIFSCDKDAVITVDGVPYRGKIVIKGSGSRMKVINVLGIEEYLFGVLPAEIGTITPSIYEAAKAQAVAARSYALARFGKHSDFDVYADTRDQVYRGYGGETPEAREAVLATRGEVLVYKDEIVEAKYHSTCGGKTASSLEVWGVDKPYLTSVKDKRFFGKPFCFNSPHFKWEVWMDRDKFEEKVLSAIGGGRIKRWKIIRNKKSERVKEIEFFTDEGKKKIKGTDFRALLGLKSTWFDIKRKGKKILIQGHGYGHGVGMCQFGAFEMSRRGYNYKKILKHYYKKTRIVKLW